MSILPALAGVPVLDRPLSLTDQVHERMREEILTATWRPGDVVLEGELAARYGVSKTPVREALRLLTQEGWIVTMPRKGYLVRPLRFHDIREIFELRLLLEPGLFAQAARVAGASGVQDLRDLVESEGRSGDPDDSPRSLGREFHRAAARLSGNERAAATVAALLDEVRRLHHLLPGSNTHGTLDEVVTDHLAILDAMGSGRPGDVFELARNHIQTSATRLTDAFRLHGD